MREIYLGKFGEFHYFSDNTIMYNLGGLPKIYRCLEKSAHSHQMIVFLYETEKENFGESIGAQKDYLKYKADYQLAAQKLRTILLFS